MTDVERGSCSYLHAFDIDITKQADKDDCVIIYSNTLGGLTGAPVMTECLMITKMWNATNNEYDYQINQVSENIQVTTSESLTTTSKSIVGAINEVNANKQNITDNSLTTTSKTIVGAINEVNYKVPDGLIKSSTPFPIMADLFWNMQTKGTEMKIRTIHANNGLLIWGQYAYGAAYITETYDDYRSTVFIELLVYDGNTIYPAGSPLRKFIRIGRLATSYQGKFKTNYNNITWEDWRIVETGNHNTLASKTNYSTLINNCVPKIADTVPYYADSADMIIHRDSERFITEVTDPIRNATADCECLSEITYYRNVITCRQTFSVLNLDTNQLYTTRKFSRTGTYRLTENTAWATILSNITWGDIIPIEYPETNITSWITIGTCRRALMCIHEGDVTMHFFDLTTNEDAFFMNLSTRHLIPKIQTDYILGPIYDSSRNYSNIVIYPNNDAFYLRLVFSNANNSSGKVTFPLKY